jgi:hypothetical protein
MMRLNFNQISDESLPIEGWRERRVRLLSAGKCLVHYDRNVIEGKMTCQECIDDQKKLDEMPPSPRLDIDWRTVWETREKQTTAVIIEDDQRKKEHNIFEKAAKLRRALRSEQIGQNAYCLSRGWALKKQHSVGVDYKHDCESLNIEFILNGALELKDVDYYPEDAAAEGRKYKIIFLGKGPNERQKKSLHRAQTDYEVFPSLELNKWVQFILDGIMEKI